MTATTFTSLQQQADQVLLPLCFTLHIGQDPAGGFLPCNLQPIVLLCYTLFSFATFARILRYQYQSVAKFLLHKFLAQLPQLLHRLGITRVLGAVLGV